MKNLLPIRKVVAGLLATLLVAGLRKAGVSLGDGDADQLVNEFIGFVVAYFVPDPRVQRVIHKLSLREKLCLLNRAIERQAAQESVDPALVKPLQNSIVGVPATDTGMGAPTGTGGHAVSQNTGQVS